MQIAQQILFALVSVFAIGLFSKKLRELIANIRLGREEKLTDQPAQRWRNMVLLALGQQKMFRNPLVAVLHLIVYAGFIIINIEVLEIVLDGILGTHRLFAAPLGNFYHFLINSFEVLALLVLIACVVFLARRNMLKIRRFISRDLDGWPRSDANYILVTEIVLMSLFLFLNASDTLLQDRGVAKYASHPTGDFVVSAWLKPLLSGMSDSGLIALERTCWWLHILGIFAFLNYLPYSKHLHILFAFPNAWYARLTPMGKMENMPSIQNEVLYAMQPELAPTGTADTPPQKFGAKDVTDLSWKNILDAYSCTECGRCSAACPANSTGKLLSPRKIMMDTRDRADELGRARRSGKESDERSLLHDYISVEELRACTTCNACVQECPVSINPLDIILQLRRYLIMEESNTPGEWAAMFGNVENNFAPWKSSPEERANWSENR
jgi:heterodisulfide reductase subunit C